MSARESRPSSSQCPTMTDLYRHVDGAVVRLLPEARWPVWRGCRSYRVVESGVIDGATWAEGCIVPMWTKRAIKNRTYGKLKIRRPTKGTGGGHHQKKIGSEPPQPCPECNGSCGHRCDICGGTGFVG